MACFFKKPFMTNYRPKLHLHNEETTFKKEVKFLGVTFDQHLTWTPNIQNLVNSCAKDLNLMRAISGTNLGSDKQTLHNRTLIQPNLDYADSDVKWHIKPK